MERLTPEHCEELQKLGLPVDIANGSFFKPDNEHYCYSAIPFILNTHECIPCWSLNNLFYYLDHQYENIELKTNKDGYWDLTIDNNIKSSGITVLETVYNMLIKILDEKPKYK